MAIPDERTEETLTAICGAQRALVFLTVHWSCPERNARQAFRVAAVRLGEAYPGLEIDFFMLDEDAEACQQWLSSLNIRQLGGGYALGAGSLLWLERGQVVASEISTNSLGVAGIIRRSTALWNELS